MTKNSNRQSYNLQRSEASVRVVDIWCCFLAIFSSALVIYL